MYVELLAISEALSYANSINYHNLVILTDSKSALQHIARCTSTIRGTPIAYIIIKQLLELQRKSKIIKLQWIPSHVGIIGNEIVDDLAKKACNDGIPLYFQPFFSDRLYLVKSYCRKYTLIIRLAKALWYFTHKLKYLCAKITQFANIIYL